MNSPGKIMLTNKILHRPEVEDTVGLSRSTIYALIAAGDFPKPLKLGKRAVGWRQSEVDAWLNSRELETIEAGQ